MKTTLIFLIIFFVGSLQNQIPCCHSECCCSSCPINACNRNPEDINVVRPCLCESTSQFSCSSNYANRYPISNNPISSPQIPSYPQNNGINLPSYPVIIRPNYPYIGSGAIPNFGGGVLKPCFCGSSTPQMNCLQNIPCTPPKINVIVNSDDFHHGRQYGNGHRHWYNWDWDSLWTPQGIALIITAIILILLIICLIIGLIVACIRSRSSREERVVVDQQSSYHKY